MRRAVRATPQMTPRHQIPSSTCSSANRSSASLGIEAAVGTSFLGLHSRLLTRLLVRRLLAHFLCGCGFLSRQRLGERDLDFLGHHNARPPPPPPPPSPHPKTTPPTSLHPT